jgi:hypothetical protein
MRLENTFRLGLLLGMASCTAQYHEVGDGEESNPDPVLSEGPSDARQRAATGLLPKEERVEVEPRVPANWVGYEVGASPGKWRYAGQMVLADADAKYEMPTESDEPGVPLEGPETMMMNDPSTGEMYEIEMDSEDVAKIAELLTKAGYNQPTPGDSGETGPVANDDAFIQKGWSNNGSGNGVDNRTDLGTGKNGNIWPYTTIGQLKNDGSTETTNGHCTATFVGGGGNATTRYAISAAHCMFASGSGDYRDPDFWPRQDRCQNNQGTNLMGCDQSPFGVWDGGVHWISSYFVSNCAGLASLNNECRKRDIVLIRVHAAAGTPFPGALGFTYETKDQLDDRSKFHRGYPNCGGAGDPVPASPTICLTRTLYGDNAFSLDDGTNETTPDYPRNYLISSDVSPGHSGGPTYFQTGGNHYVFAVASTETCSGSACTVLRPNRIRAIDPTWYNEMVAFMGL